MRAVICSRFGGYTFEVVDGLPLDRMIDIYTAAEWFADQESKALRKT